MCHIRQLIYKMHDLNTIIHGNSPVLMLPFWIRRKSPKEMYISQFTMDRENRSVSIINPSYLAFVYISLYCCIFFASMWQMRQFSILNLVVKCYWILYVLNTWALIKCYDRHCYHIVNWKQFELLPNKAVYSWTLLKTN